MKGHTVSQVGLQEQEKPLTWPEEADIICFFSTTEGYSSFRCWLAIELYNQIKEWLENWENARQIGEVEDMEFHQLLIRVNARIGTFQAQILDECLTFR